MNLDRNVERLHVRAPRANCGYILNLMSWRASHPHDDFHSSGADSRHSALSDISTVQRQRGVWCASAVLGTPW